MIRYIVSPHDLLRRAICSGLLPTGIDGLLLMNAAERVALDLAADWPEHEGYGSSDFTFTLQAFLDAVGVKTEFRDNRLCRVVA